MASTSQIQRGTLYPAICVRTCSSIAGRSAARPSRSCTRAATRCPSSSSGIPMTSASNTSGQDFSAPSTSSGKTFSPPEFTHVLPRPSKVTVPSSSTLARSPAPAPGEPAYLAWRRLPPLVVQHDDLRARRDGRPAALLGAGGDQADAGEAGLGGTDRVAQEDTRQRRGEGVLDRRGEQRSAGGNGQHRRVLVATIAIGLDHRPAHRITDDEEQIDLVPLDCAPDL